MAVALHDSNVYQALDPARDEIRVLSFVKPSRRILNDIKDDVLQCTLSNVALDAHSPEYAKFLELDGASMPKNGRSVLWSHLICREESDEQTFSTMYQPNNPKGLPLPPRAGPELQGSMVPIDEILNKPEYHDTTRYNANTRRWAWGDFIALSYQWGDLAVTSEIVLNEVRVNIPKNLEAIIRRIRQLLNRSPNQKIHVWIDYICIKQNDIVERNAQVKRMKSIYAESTCVIFDKKWFRREFEHMMTQTYWERLWIIQEVLLANTNCRILSGDKSCLLTTWFRIFNIYNSPDTGFATSQLSYDRLVRLGMLNDLIADKSNRLEASPDLMRLLWLSREAKQKDDRDKIYAILGLVDSEIQALVVPDYNAPLLDVYRGFVRDVAKATGCLDIIFQGTMNQHRNLDFPSWVPDWRISCPHDITSVVQYDIFCAAGATRHSFVEEDEAGHLTCRGVRIDTVNALGCSEIPSIPHVHDFSLAATPTPYSNIYGGNDGVSSAILETLTLGKMASLQPGTIDGAPLFKEADATAYQGIYWLPDHFQQCYGHILVAEEMPKESPSNRSADLRNPSQYGKGEGLIIAYRQRRVAHATEAVTLATPVALKGGLEEKRDLEFFNAET
ncbi:heterokaryon incompatibility protein-domain-containing protein [Lasiosphaeris hirsuta]|uniref:Heterokaryon incompatibility protein-domain-containing protein n=1 Tax=Lasiosphaeris hirsuta TaxID=260670 RepID=A0AA40B118_9PEZI|nr:heterokaryon incompatibility protein-domain-containing protein [Lasiosphaeris hirsuta]